MSLQFHSAHAIWSCYRRWLLSIATCLSTSKRTASSVNKPHETDVLLSQCSQPCCGCTNLPKVLRKHCFSYIRHTRGISLRSPRPVPIEREFVCSLPAECSKFSRRLVQREYLANFNLKKVNFHLPTMLSWASKISIQSGNLSYFLVSEIKYSTGALLRYIVIFASQLSNI